MAGHTVYLEVIRNARHRQLVKRRVIIVSGVVVLVALGWAYMAGLIVPRYPRKWVGVHTGMTREQIHTSIGPPTTDSFEAKGLDRWKTKALLGERTLDGPLPAESGRRSGNLGRGELFPALPTG